jgi:translation initiation factor 4E
VLAAIGETLEDDNDDEVMGVVVNVRKGFYRVGLWTRSNGSPSKKAGGGEPRTEVLTRIGQRFKTAMSLPAAEQVEFTGHSDSAHSGSTRARAKITV